MSFCRWGKDSDVYCYCHTNGFFQVHVAKKYASSGNLFITEDKFITEDNLNRQFDTVPETIFYLNVLEKKGFAVPKHTYKRLIDYHKQGMLKTERKSAIL